MENRVIVYPADENQYYNWIGRLQDAGVEYEVKNLNEVKKLMRQTYEKVLILDDLDARNIIAVIGIPVASSDAQSNTSPLQPNDTSDRYKQYQQKKAGTPPAPVKKKWKTWKIVLASIVGVYLLIVIINMIVILSGSVPADNQPVLASSNNVTDQKTADSLRTIAAIEKTKSQIENAIEQIKNFDPSQFRGTPEAVASELVVFRGWSYAISQAASSPDSLVRAAGERLAKYVKAIQIKEFPKIRKAYMASTEKTFWLEDVEVRVYGKGNTILEFAGGIFAANANKQQMQEKINVAVTGLRFKQVRYKWYSGADEYTYYTINSANDGDIVPE